MHAHLSAEHMMHQKDIAYSIGLVEFQGISLVGNCKANLSSKADYLNRFFRKNKYLSLSEKFIIAKISTNFPMEAFEMYQKRQLLYDSQGKICKLR